MKKLGFKYAIKDKTKLRFIMLCDNDAEFGVAFINSLFGVGNLVGAWMNKGILIYSMPTKPRVYRTVTKSNLLTFLFEHSFIQEHTYYKFEFLFKEISKKEMSLYLKLEKEIL